MTVLYKNQKINYSNYKNQILQCPNLQGIHILKKKNDNIIAEFLIRGKYDNRIKISLKDNKELLKEIQNIIEITFP